MKPATYDPKLLAALGEATVEFSLVEHYVAYGIALLTFGGDGEGQEKAELVTAGMSVNDKVDLFSRLHHHRFPDDKDASDQMKALCGAIDTIRKQRNAFQHSLWLLYEVGTATSVSVKRSRLGVNRSVRTLTTRDLELHVDQVREVRNQTIDFVHSKLSCRLGLCGGNAV